MLNATLRALLVGVVACQFVPSMVMAAAERRALTADDINAVREVSDPQLSPDGQWVAYVVRTADPAKDQGNSHIWMSSWDGKQSVQLNKSYDSE